MIALALIVAVVICVASDRLERRRRLGRLRRSLGSQPDVSDEQFAAAMPEVRSPQVLEMRALLATFLGVNPQKIAPGWRFCEERDLRGMEGFIYHAFAVRYATDQLRDGRAFKFPASEVATVRELFLEAARLRNGN